MTVRMWSADEPAKTRLDYWERVVSSAAGGQVRARGSGFRSQIRQAEIGSVTVLGVQTSEMQSSRIPDLRGNSDPDMWKVNLAVGGRGVFDQDGRESRLKPGEFLLMDLGRPSHLAVERWFEASVVMFPRKLLPVRHNRIRELTAVRFTAQDPYAALVASLGRALVRHIGSYKSARDARIGTAFLDLLALAIATRVDRLPDVPADSRQHAMTLRVQAFIERHLGDPVLSPGTIAAAHHISVRTLHKLFEAQEHTITASIRRQRLERSRRDLLDPALLNHTVSSVGARWGFPDAATFSRAFRAAYGVPPSEYRAIHADVSTPGTD